MGYSSLQAAVADLECTRQLIRINVEVDLSDVELALAPSPDARLLNRRVGDEFHLDRQLAAHLQMGRRLAVAEQRR
jgi:hypothetical protein